MPIGAHFTQTNPDNALLANPSSILNYSQGRIVGLRNTYAFPRAATDAVIEMVTDPKFDAREIGRKYVRKLERNFRKFLDGLRSSYTLPRATMNAVIDFATDSKFDALEITRKYVRILERKGI